MTWPAKTLILSSCPQRLERDPCMPSITHGLVFFLSATSPLPQSGIQRSPHQPSVPPALLLPGCPPPPAPLVHLPLCPDRGVARRAWRGLTYSGSGVAAVPLPHQAAWCEADSLRESLRPSVLGIQAVLSGMGGRWCDLRLPAPSERPAFPSELDNRKNR